MDKECYNSGQCKICGCKTTALQLANKPCDKPCYPSMMSKKNWNKIKKNHLVYCKKTKLQWGVCDKKFFSVDIS